MLRKTTTFVNLFSASGTIILVFLVLLGGCPGPTPTPTPPQPPAPTPPPQVNRPPEIIKGVMLPAGTVDAGKTVTLRVVSVSDPDGDAIVYNWRANRGKIEPSGPSKDPVATYTAPVVAGEDTVTVIVSDGKGGTTSDSIRFNVVAPPVTLPTPTRLIQITEPVDAAIVPRDIVVRGTFSELPSDSTIWTVVYIDGLYWPQRRANQFHIEPVPTWQASTWVGTEKDSGKQFDILAVLADRTSDSFFTEWLMRGEETGKYPGLVELPKGAKIYDKVTVIRR